MTTSARVPNFRYSFVLRRTGRLSWRPVHFNGGEAATFLIGAPEFRGPPWAAARTALVGIFGEFDGTSGRLERRPLQGWLIDFQKFDTRAGQVSGPYGRGAQNASEICNRPSVGADDHIGPCPEFPKLFRSTP